MNIFVCYTQIQAVGALKGSKLTQVPFRENVPLRSTMFVRGSFSFYFNPYACNYGLNQLTKQIFLA